jgi:Arc/MetJ family transcription regulator
MKRTNIVIDEKLIKTGLKITGLKTQRALIDFALRELLRRESQIKILELRGTIEWQGDLELMRQSRISE